ncbi:MAG: RagB/SusD family nutrient uptake outer membrane protein [Bacteroidales bacterium]|nr:RagB/SusD family nutrient uptake outer membrane protein [Bacteroidales bacterium]
MKKSVFYTILFGVLALGSACSEDYLDLKDPNRSSADTYWKQETDYRLAINAAYSCFRLPGYFGRWYHADMILRGDEGWSKSPAPHWIAIATFNTTSYSSSEGVVQPWLMLYRQIYYCNQIFDYMNDRGYALFTDKGEADRILGQAYFMRGFSYWYLAGTYAKGPRQLNSTDNGEVIEQEEIYKQALSDFEMAETLLPVDWTEFGSAQKGRITMGGAKAMMAKTAMQLAGYYKRPGNDGSLADTYWEMAKTKMDETEALGLYELVPNYRDNFSEWNELNNESIFEIIFRDEIYNGKEVGTQRGKFIGFPVGGIGAWHDVYARAWLLDEFKKEMTADGKEDPRLMATLIYNKPGDTTRYYGKTWAEWDAAATSDADKLTQVCYWNKYTNAEFKASEDYKNGINFRIVRLADIYLMQAEVINELDGDRSIAVEYINKVRRRSGMADLNAADFNNYETLLEQIKHERLVELCGECTRWYDLDRWGILFDQAEINWLALNRDEDFSTFRLNISHRFIIPNSEISLYPGLTQNNGY